jgi:cytochrome c oxidase subunit 2
MRELSVTGNKAGGMKQNQPNASRSIKSVVLTALAGAMAVGLGGAAHAAEPQAWDINLQPAATSIMRDIRWLHDWWIMPMIVAITIIVTGLLVYVMLRYNTRANPIPRKFSHNTLVEIIWTAVPVLILIAIAVPSFRLLYYKDVFPTTQVVDGRTVPVTEADVVTVKASGWRWYWTYDYAESADGAGDGVNIISNMVFDADIRPPQLRQLSTDNPLVLPAGKIVRLNVTGMDVIHAWTIPSFGVKIDAVPGRVNQVWFRIDEPGRYFGQCSEICGIRHAFMPIEVRALPLDQYEQWLAAARTDPDAANALLARFQPQYDPGSQIAALSEAQAVSIQN